MSNIPIKNVYYMLTYAFSILHHKDYKKVELEDFENIEEMCSHILCAGISNQIKRGLQREYMLETESLSCIRGKINISESLKKNTLMNNKLVCEYDEFSLNSYMNRIIKTTCNLLINAKISRNLKKSLKKLMIYFTNVEEIQPNSINWNFHFNHSNKSYQLLMNVCYLVIKGLILSKQKGYSKMAHFIDDQAMHRLYEKFILEYYKFHFPNLNANADEIQWITDDGNFEFLPKMRSDITLKSGNTVLIIDAKFYEHNFQEYYDTPTAVSANLYQIFTYVKNMQLKDDYLNKSVSGMLLYAGTKDKFQPNNSYSLSGNNVRIKTLWLDCDFSEIKAQLDEIAKSVS